jgi:phage gpG-like protein
MAFQLSFSIEGDKQFSRRLHIVTDGVSDFTNPLKQVSTELHKTFQLNFSQRGGLFGGWPERTPQFKKGQRTDTWPLLEKTGVMRKSFLTSSTKTKIELTNSAEYFKYHQSNQPRKRIPRRVMMKIDQDRKTFIVKTFQEYLIVLMRSRG